MGNGNKMCKEVKFETVDKERLLDIEGGNSHIFDSLKTLILEWFEKRDTTYENK